MPLHLGLSVYLFCVFTVDRAMSSAPERNCLRIMLLGSSLRKKANGMSPGSCCKMERGRGRWKNEVDVKRNRQELRDMATQQHTSVCGMVPFLSYKSCTADTILNSIILPLENTSTCTICQPRPLRGRRSLGCSLVPRDCIHLKPQHNLCPLSLLLFPELCS